MLRRVALMVAGVGAMVVLAAGSAVAGTGRAYDSPEQAGYAVSGARFKVAEVYVKLPDASRFAREIGRLSPSVQLWTADLVVDVSVTACTDSACRPGGKPVARKYALAFTVWRRSTGALICSTRDRTCPQVPSSWNRVRFAPGRTVRLVLFYDHASGFLEADANSHQYFGYFPGAGLAFTQARIVMEFGTSPYSHVAFRAPKARTLLATFGVPPGPPFAAEFANYHNSSGCVSSRWTHHEVRLTSHGKAAKRAEASPSGLSNLGCNFSVYLEP